GHVSVEADMPDAAACRKRQIQIVARNEIRQLRWQHCDAFVSARVQKATAGNAATLRLRPANHSAGRIRACANRESYVCKRCHEGASRWRSIGLMRIANA